MRVLTRPVLINFDLSLSALRQVRPGALSGKIASLKTLARASSSLADGLSL